MFKFTKKIAIAASLVALYSGDHAFGSNGNNIMEPGTIMLANTAAYNNDLVNAIPNDIWKNILAKASEETHPDHFAPVCQKLNAVMHDTRGIPQDPNNPGANNFKQQCVKIYEENENLRRFKNGILRYTPVAGGAVVELKFSDLVNPFCGTFDLSKCGNRSQSLRITTSMEEFFKVRGENEDRLVFLTCPFHVVEQAIHSNPDHPFAKILSNWDKSKAPIGMFWRMGNFADPFSFDYLVTESMKQLSEKNLFENWQKSGAAWAGGAGVWVEWCAVWVSCLFLKNQN